MTINDIETIILMLNLLSDGYSLRKMAELIGLDRSTVTRVIECLNQNSITLENIHTYSHYNLFSLIYPRKNYCCFDNPDEVAEEIGEMLKERYMTRKMLHERIYSNYGISLSSFYDFCNKFEIKQPKADMSHTYKPGEMMEADWAGDRLPIDILGQRKYAKLLIFVLSYSKLFFPIAFPSETVDNFMKGHVKAFNYFGGTTKNIKIDNAKVGVQKASKTEPIFNTQYYNLCKHYNILIAPARIRSPQDKPNVEKHVDIIYKRLYILFRDKNYVSYDELNNLLQVEAKLYGEKTISRSTYTRNMLFEQEKVFFNQLPVDEFIIFTTKNCKVKSNYTIEFDKSFYSVPYKYIGKYVNLLFTDDIINIKYDGQLIATHKRSHDQKYDKFIKKEHMHPQHAAYTEYNRDEILKKGQEIGKETYKLFSNILDNNKISDNINIANCISILSKFTNDKVTLELISRYINENGITPNVKNVMDVYNSKLYLD
jgi:transposase